MVTQILSVLLTGFFTQRVVITYFFPDEFDYNKYVGFSTQNIQNAAQFYFLCVLFLSLGICWAILSNNKNRKHCCTRREEKQVINFLFLSINFSMLARVALRIIIVGFFYKIYVLLVTGFGLTGGVYTHSETILKWSLGISDALSPFVIFSWIYFPAGSRERKYASIALVMVVVNALVMSSKGFLLGMAVQYYLIMILLGNMSSHIWVLARK